MTSVAAEILGVEEPDLREGTRRVRQRRGNTEHRLRCVGQRGIALIDLHAARGDSVERAVDFIVASLCSRMAVCTTWLTSARDGRPRRRAVDSVCGSA